MQAIKKLALEVLPPRILKHLRAVDNYYNGDEELRYLKFLCNRNKTAVDIGANIGVYTYFMARRVKHVYAYEPVPSLVDFLQASFPKGVTVRGKAVSNKAGTAQLLVPVSHGRELHELSSLSEKFSDEVETHTFEVPTVRLDDEDIGDVGLIKIEVQQHERAVLEGTRQTLEIHRPNLIVAWAPLLCETDVKQAFAELFDLGYRGYFTFNHELMDLDRYNPDVHAREENLGKPGRFMNTNLLFSIDALVLP